VGIMPDIKDDETQKILLSCMENTLECGKLLFPDRCFRPFSSIHKEIAHLLDRSKSQKVAVAAPRGIGKTTLMSIVYPAKEILFQETKFLVPVSCTSTQAVMQSENLKAELMSNTMVTGLFGSIESDQFAKDLWKTSSGIMVLPRGQGQQIRGLLDKSRPDLFLVDDLEDPIEARSDENRNKIKRWFYGDLMQAIDKGSTDWRIIVIGTIVHGDSLLRNLIDDPDWEGVNLSMCDDDLNTLWPEFMTTEQIKNMYDEYKRQNTLDVFYLDMMNRVSALDKKGFDKKYFQYYAEEEVNLNTNPNVETLVICDPARKTQGERLSDSAVVCVSVNFLRGIIYIREAISERMHPDALYDTAITMALKYAAAGIAVEVTGLHEYITYPLRNELERRKLHTIDVLEVNATGRKDERIASLIPFYKARLVKHNKVGLEDYERQAIAWPDSTKKDAIDAAAHVVGLLALSHRLFAFNNKEESFDNEPFVEQGPLVEDEYKDLGPDLPPLTDSWKLMQ